VYLRTEASFNPSRGDGPWYSVGVSVAVVGDGDVAASSMSVSGGLALKKDARASLGVALAVEGDAALSAVALVVDAVAVASVVDAVAVALVDDAAVAPGGVVLVRDGVTVPPGVVVAVVVSLNVALRYDQFATSPDP
jgi:hypothetical protein